MEGQSKKSSQLEAIQVLEKMAQRYAGCATYEDRGQVQQVFRHLNSNTKQTVRKPFSTAFVRPSRFRFQFKRYADNRSVQKYIVWQRGSAIRTWWTVGQRLERLSKLSMAIAGATGVSGSSALTVPRMLLPGQINAWSIHKIAQPLVIGNGTVNRAICLRIQGADALGDSVTIWVDKKDWLLRKVKTISVFKDRPDPFEVVSTTTYEPKIDKKISSGKLQFRPRAI